jgi:hypothetical protein
MQVRQVEEEGLLSEALLAWEVQGVRVFDLINAWSSLFWGTDYL